jgi:hypothetical protein
MAVRDCSSVMGGCVGVLYVATVPHDVRRLYPTNACPLPPGL